MVRFLYIFAAVFWLLRWRLSSSYCINTFGILQPLGVRRFILYAQSTFTGPGRKVADRIKKQFGLANDVEVRNVRRALKRYRRDEQKRMLKARRNTIKAEYNIGLAKKEKNTMSCTPNPYLYLLKPLQKSNKNIHIERLKKKRVGINMRLDVCADLCGGSSIVRPVHGTCKDIYNLHFIGSYPHTQLLPTLQLPEVCLVGRSNVGKSSLINVLMSYIRNKSNKCDAAFVSKTPGYTKSINMFKVANSKGFGLLTLVDLPGYGYAQTKDQELVKAMQSALKAYIQRRNELKLILFLVDGSIPPQNSDVLAAAELKKMHVPHLVICTRMDKINANDAPLNIHQIRNELDISPPLPFLYSKYGGGDLGTVWNAIFDACNDKFDISKLQIKDIIKEHEAKPDFVKQSLEDVNNKQLIKLVYKNYQYLPTSLQGIDYESKTRSEILDILNIAIQRRQATEGEVPNLQQYKATLKSRKCPIPTATTATSNTTAANDIDT